MRHLRYLALPLVAALTLAQAPRAAADADPASDFLLAAPVFYPFQPSTSTELKHALEGALAQLKSKGLSLKVAIIGGPTDLGGVPNLWGKPQTYADFLEKEIAFNRPQPLLVVMPAGFGVSHAGSASTLSGLTVDTAHRANGLTRTAILAVQRIAGANGTPISLGAIPSATAKSGGGTSPLITFAAPAAVVVLVILVMSLLRRRTAKDETPYPAGNDTLNS